MRIALAWKGLFELTMVNLVLIAILLQIWQSPSTRELWIIAAINWAVFFPAVYLIGKIIEVKPYEQPIPDPANPAYPVGTEELSEGVAD